MSKILLRLGFRLPTPLEYAVADLQSSQLELLRVRSLEEQFHHAANMHHDRINRLRQEIEAITKDQGTQNAKTP